LGGCIEENSGGKEEEVFPPHDAIDVEVVVPGVVVVVVVVVVVAVSL